MCTRLPTYLHSGTIFRRSPLHSCVIHGVRSPLSSLSTRFSRNFGQKLPRRHYFLLASREYGEPQTEHLERRHLITASRAISTSQRLPCLQYAWPRSCRCHTTGARIVLHETAQAWDGHWSVRACLPDSCSYPHHVAKGRATVSDSIGAWLTLNTRKSFYNLVSIPRPAIQRSQKKANGGFDNLTTIYCKEYTVAIGSPGCSHGTLR